MSSSWSTAGSTASSTTHRRAVAAGGGLLSSSPHPFTRQGTTGERPNERTAEDRPARDDEQDPGSRSGLADGALSRRLPAARLRAVLRGSTRAHAGDADALGA